MRMRITAICTEMEGARDIRMENTKSLRSARATPNLHGKGEDDIPLKRCCVKEAKSIWGLSCYDLSKQPV